MVSMVAAATRRRWLLTASAFLIAMLVDGLRFSFGVLFVDLVQSFNSSRGDTAWIGAIIYGASNFAGTLASFTIKKIGCAWTIVMGSVMAAVGIFLSSFAPSIPVLYLTYGLLPGTGVCFMSLSMVVSITRNIDEGRSLAMGMAMCGGGVGSFVFNPLIHVLLETYAWRGTLMIISGIMLNGIFLGLPSRERRCVRKVRENDTPSLVDGVSAHSLNTPVTHNDTDDKSDHGFNNENVLRTSLKAYECDNIDHEKEAISLLPVNDTCKPDNVNKEKPNSITEYSIEFRDTLCKPNHSLSASMGSTGDDNHTHSRTSSIRKLLSVMLTIFPVHVFKNTPALIFIISAVVRSFSYFIPLTYLPDLVVEKGFSTAKAAWAAAILGITQSAFRIVIGWLSDFRCVDRLVLFSVCIVVSGGVSTLCFLFSSYELLIMYTVVFAVFFSGETALVPVIAGDVSDKDGVGDTMGMLMTVCGFGALFGTPVAGWLFDKTGRYDISFAIAGSVIAFSGFITCLVKLLPENKHRNPSISIEIENENIIAP